MTLGRATIRCLVGPLFIGHGTQKLFGWFGGAGPEQTGGFFESMGLRPGRRNAIAAGASEAVGGALLFLGALTPLATTLIQGTMITAIRTAHRGKGPWVTSGGYEYNLVLIGGLAAHAERGPGRPSVDDRWFPGLAGTRWALASLAAAAAGSYLATARGEAEPEPAGAEQ
jgi:putative oxidoreductase